MVNLTWSPGMRKDISFIKQNSKKPLQQKDVEEVISQVKATSLDCYRFGFISRSGFELEKKDNLILIDLKELFDDID